MDHFKKKMVIFGERKFKWYDRKKTRCNEKEQKKWDLWGNRVMKERYNRRNKKGGKWKQY